MTHFDTNYQAWRRDCLNKLSNMDPYDLVCELDIPTDLLIDRLWDIIELYVEEQFDDEHDEGDECGE